VAAGADFPAYLFDLLVEGRRTFPQAYRVGVYARNWSKDVGWLAQHLRAWRSGRVRTSPLATLARETLHVLGGRERSDTFTLDDWRPGVGEVGALARLVTDGAARTLRGRWAGLGPVRRARAARAAAAWRSARRVLFVCKGNICRSPFAERLAVARDATRRYESAGYYPKTGRPSPDTALTVAPEFGLELETHRSQIVTAEQMARADLVVIFDEENRRELARAFPGERRKVHYLGALLPDGEATITDPYGGTPDDFRRCYARIGAALARVLAPGSASVSIRPSG
jgi:protein-tyrosine-phosphatase